MTNTLLTAEEREAIEGRDARFAMPLHAEGKRAWVEAVHDRRRLLQAYSAMEKEREADARRYNELYDLWQADNHRVGALSARCAGLEKDAARWNLCVRDGFPQQYLNHEGELCWAMKGADTRIEYPGPVEAIDAALEAK